MRPEAFTSPAGELVRIPEGCHAFVPNPVPPVLPPPSPALVNAQIAAASSIGRLQQALVHSKLDPFMVVWSLLQREAVFSSRMEGTYTTPEQLALFGAAPPPESPAKERKDAQEVSNHYRAMSTALATIRKVDAAPTISGPLIRNAHKALMDKMPDVKGKPGEFRVTQNAIGLDGTDIRDARFVPPPAAEVPHLMANLLEFSNSINADSDPSHLVALAIQHYQFETIHPFSDGNGRLGRFLATLTMTARGFLQEPLLYVSAWLERSKKRYCDLMLGVSQRSEWEPWILFFVQALDQSARDGVRVCDRLLSLKEEFRGKVKSALWPVLDLLFNTWIITADEVATVTERTKPMAGIYIEQLKAAGVLRQLAVPKRPRRYISDAITNIVFEPVQPA